MNPFEKAKQGDRVRVKERSTWNGGFVANAGDVLTLVNDKHGCPFYQGHVAFACDQGTLVNDRGERHLRISIDTVELLAGDSPDSAAVKVCTCDLWKGCTCGVFAAEMAKKEVSDEV